MTVVMMMLVVVMVRGKLIVRVNWMMVVTSFSMMMIIGTFYEKELQKTNSFTSPLRLLVIYVHGTVFLVLVITKTSSDQLEVYLLA